MIVTLRQALGDKDNVMLSLPKLKAKPTIVFFLIVVSIYI